MSSIQYIISTQNVYPKDFLTGQESRWGFDTVHINEADISDRWYIPGGLRARHHFLQKIKEVRDIIKFMPLPPVVLEPIGIPISTGEELGFGLSRLDSKGVALQDPQLVVATVDPDTRDFIVGEDVTEQFIDFAKERKINLHFRHEGWQPEWTRRGRSAERR